MRKTVSLMEGLGQKFKSYSSLLMVYVRCIKLVIFYRAGVQDKWVQIIVSQVLCL